MSCNPNYSLHVISFSSTALKLLFTGRRIPGSVTRSFSPQFLWDSWFYLNLSVFTGERIPGSFIEASILIVCEILNFIWIFLSVVTGGRIPGSGTRSFNPYCLWDSGYYLNLSLCSNMLVHSWVFYLEFQTSLSVRSSLLSESFCLFSQVGGFLGLLLEALILTVCKILDFIWTFLSVYTGWRVPGSVTWSFSSHCLWDPRFYPAGCGCSVEREKSKCRGATSSSNWDS